MTTNIKKFRDLQYAPLGPNKFREVVIDLEQQLLKWLNENPRAEVVWVDKGRGEDYTVWTVYYRELSGRE